MRALYIVIIALFETITASAAVRYVAPDGSGTAPYDSWAKAATGLTQVIVGSAAGDEVLVTNGTYTKWNAVWNTQLVWRAVNGPAVTIIDGAPNSSVLGEIYKGDFHGFTFRGQTNQYGWLFEGDHVISNCVFTLNRNTRDNNPAVGFYGSHTSRVYNCYICCNSSQYEGGGIGTSGEGGYATLILYDCVVSNNVAAQDGGGVVALTVGTVYFNGGTITRNQGANGGAAYAYNTAYLTISNALVTYNISTADGALRGISAQCLRAYNCILYGNVSHAILSVTYGGSLYSCTVVGNCASGTTYGATYGPVDNYNNCVIWGNYPKDVCRGLYSNSLWQTLSTAEGGPSLISGNVSNVPSFSGTWDDAFVPALTNTGLNFPVPDLADLQLAAGSAAIDKGSNEAWMTGAHDFGGVLDRIINGTVDIGAMEYNAVTPAATAVSPIAALLLWEAMQ